MLRSIIISIILSLALVAPVLAKTPDEINNLVNSLSQAELSQVQSNLLEMAEGMSPPEYNQIMWIYDSITSAVTSHDNLLIVTKIYTMMIDNRDKAVVARFVELLSKRAIATSNNTIRMCDRVLPKMQSQVAIAEVNKARDLVQKIRDEIQRTFPGS